MKKILYFTAVWCSPCRGFSPIMDGLSGEINIEKVDVDSSKDLVSHYNIKNVPTCVLIENGIVKDKFVGIKSKEAVLNFYNQ